MAGHLGQQYKNLILEAALGGNFTPNGEVAFALYSSDPGESGLGGTELVGGAYDRAVYDNDSVTWATAVGGIKTNAIVINFPTPTADWAEATHFAVWGVDDGYCIATGPLDDPIQADTGELVRFPIGSLAIQVEDI